ncbi:MAG: carboxypeptidase regulatory-like domain-containing protein [Acidobacteria bacterium]|nr:carboxypeptidase regulatory-like domain-containing protein [Acidobacteriota bacterium]
MRLLILLFVFFALSTATAADTGVADSSGRKIVLTGNVFDPNGALVPGAQIRATSASGAVTSTDSSASGIFSLPVAPGLYKLQITKSGFISANFPEFFVVNSTTGKMYIDIVLFPGLSHSPCGYSGAECLPENLLVESFEIRYVPSLKRLIRDLGPKEIEPNRRP